MLVTQLVLLSALAATQAAPQVRIGRTTLSGRDVGTNIEFFGGIPYAEPPVGALRLHPPLLKSRLNVTTFNAADYGKACIQPVAEPSTISEDCLTINLHRPAGLSSSAKLPVLFWTYGGAFIMGSSGQFNGTQIVERSVQRGTPVILVTFNYRLGPLGFPQGQEAGNRKSLNLGILDEIAALEWVQANIGTFGGDKSKVTIFGESAGAVVTGVLFLNPGLGRLARAGIMQSGGSATFPSFTAGRNEPEWQSFVGKVISCAGVANSGNTFSCLRNASTEEVTAAALQSVTLENIINNLFWTPTIDGPGGVFPDLSSRLYSRGHFAKLPFIAGTNLDEGTLFAHQTPVTTQFLQDELVGVSSPRAGSTAALQAAVARLLELYPEIPSIGSPYGTGDELFGLPASYKRHASILGDLALDGPRRLWSQAAAKAGVKNYGYHFTHPQVVPALGVFHSAEIPFVFGQVPPEADQTTRDISTVMMDFWISFAVSLNPNDGKGAQRPQWPQYTSSQKVLLQLMGGNTTTITDQYRSDQITFITENAGVLQH